MLRTVLQNFPLCHRACLECDIILLEVAHGVNYVVPTIVGGGFKKLGS